jgi:hypothetical protein
LFLKLQHVDYDTIFREYLHIIHSMMNAKMMLSQIAELSSGHAFRSSFADEPVGNVRVVAMAQSVGEVLAADAALPRIAFSGPTSRLALVAGDVLFRPRGVSTQAIYVESVQDPCIFAAPLVRMRVNDPQQLDSWYLHWVLNSPHIQRDISTQARGSMIRMVSLQSLRDIAIPVPPLEVQRKIAELARLQRHERALTAKLAQETQNYAEQVLWAAAQKAVSRGYA